jgi:hypothetical protein
VLQRVQRISQILWETMAISCATERSERRKLLDDLFDRHPLPIKAKNRGDANSCAHDHGLPAAAGWILFDVSVVEHWREEVARIVQRNERLLFHENAAEELKQQGVKLL